MFCLEGGFIHIDQTNPLKQGPPAWLHSFVESEDYLSKCSSDCFRGNLNPELGERFPRSHRRRYFCTECPEEGGICLGRVIERHLSHRILKVRKVTGMEGSVIRVEDIEPLLNISYIARHSSSSNDLLFLKLKTNRQPMWGAGCKHKVSCFECLRVASTDDNDKYCSIKCAYPNIWTSTAEDLNQPRGSSGPKSCRITRPMHRRKLVEAVPEIQPHPAPRKSMSLSRSGTVGQRSKGWLSRFLKFGSSKKTTSPTETLQHIQLSEDTSRAPSTKSSPGGWSSRMNFGTQYAKECEGGHTCTPDRTHPSRFPLRTTKQPRYKEKVKDRNLKSSGSFKDGGPWTSAQDPEDSSLPNSTSVTAVPRPSRVNPNGLNVKAGPVTRIAWRSEEDSGDKEEVEKRWGEVRSWVLNSAGMGYSTYRSENESKENFRESVGGFEPTALHGRASQELASHSARCETTESPGYAPVVTSNTGIAGKPRIFTRNFLRHEETIC